jgi:hypothetical protein
MIYFMNEMLLFDNAKLLRRSAEAFSLLTHLPPYGEKSGEKREQRQARLLSAVRRFGKLSAKL